MTSPTLRLDALMDALRDGGSEFRVTGRAAETFTGACIDTRTLKPGALFFALQANRDGHAFLDQAVKNGASGLVVEPNRTAPKWPGVTVIEVPSPRQALGCFGRAARRAINPDVVAVTGSSGKTTTKELIAAALGTDALKTEGNLNNDLGVPLTLLRLTHAHEYAVVEMGMSAPGEIATLAGLAEPRVGVITSIGPAHLETMGSIEAIANAKGELFWGLVRREGPRPVRPVGGRSSPPAQATLSRVATSPLQPAFAEPPRTDRIAIYPEDELLLVALAERAKADQRIDHAFVLGPSTKAEGRIVSAQPQGSAGTAVELDLLGHRIRFLLPLMGMHNVRNAAAAALAALALGRTPDQVAEGLSEAKPPKQRGEVVAIGGREVLVDLYNANPSSMRAALSTLGALAAGKHRAFAVLGDMLSLGDSGEAMHQEMGAFVKTLGLTGLIGVGPLSAELCRAAVAAGMPQTDVVVTFDKAAAAKQLAERTRPGDWILIKGSRGMKMEEVLDAFRQELG